MDTTTVYFNGIEHGFEVSSILAQFSLFGHDIKHRWYGAEKPFRLHPAVLIYGRRAD